MVYLNWLVSQRGLDQEELLKLIKKTLKHLSIKKDLSVTFCGNKMIQTLNKQYRKKNRPTDVLSFEMDDSRLLGDIFISIPTALKNTKQFGTVLFEEIVFLVVHGVLHLLGHDHYKNNEEKKMKKLEKEIMFKLFKKDYYA